MEDVDIALQPRRLFKDNPPLRLSDNFAASWFNICHVPAGMHEVDWHNPPQRLLVLWLTGEVEFETSDGNTRRLPPGVSCWLRIRRARDTSPVILPRASSWCTWPSPSIKANHAVGTSAAGPSRHFVAAQPNRSLSDRSGQARTAASVANDPNPTLPLVALRLRKRCSFSRSQGRIDCKRLRWRRCAENSAARVGSDTALGGRHCLS
jgi:hypothetical protein